MTVTGRGAEKSCLTSPLRTPHAIGMASGTVRIDSQALATLRYIRASMDAAGTVAIPGAAGVGVGIVGLAAATLSSTGLLHAYWLEIWLLAAAAGAASGAFFLAHRQPGELFTLRDIAVRRVYWCLLPCLLAGAVLTVVLLKGGQTQAIPGTWLLLYGCGLLYASTVTSRAIAVLGGCFVLLAILAFILPPGVQTRAAVLGIGFGELHVLYGAFVRRTGQGSLALGGGSL
jgi:hypothetical protein